MRKVYGLSVIIPLWFEKLHPGNFQFLTGRKKYARNFPEQLLHPQNVLLDKKYQQKSSKHKAFGEVKNGLGILVLGDNDSSERLSFCNDFIYNN